MRFFRFPCKSHAARVVTACAGAALVVGASVALMGQYGGAPIWWEAGGNERMPLSAVFQDTTGDLLVYNAEGELTARQHPFFAPMGANGRACITCHQLSNAMSVSPDRVQQRWIDTGGKDPVFEAVDGSNCPDLPQSRRESHALLLDKGLFRIYQPWPAAGVTPEFTMEVVRDPTGCNSGKVFGLHAAEPTVSVYRRPRIVGNMKYLESGNVAFTADSRATTLEAQAQDAFTKHEQGKGALSAEDMRALVQFERQIYVAQGRDTSGGDLSSFGAPALLGAWNLKRGQPGSQGFMTVAHWAGTSSSTEEEYRRSVERGSQVFSARAFPITETANFTATAGRAPVQGTCATCHSERMTGVNTTQAWMDIGTSSMPWAGDQKDLPLFKITCAENAAPHPYLGRVIYTNDPGRALVTGKCADVGSIVMQQLRGLSARAPYFTGGSAKDLQAVVDYYDRRFNAHYTDQEKKDLVNFLGAL